jgi:hypothetical protein
MSDFAELTAIARALRRSESEVLRDAFKQTHEKLRPLGEPLVQQFALDRWLGDGREEEYSDRLAWLLGQTTIAELTDILDLPLRARCVGSYLESVVGEREVWIDGLRGNKSGRMDILARLPPSILLVIEVKRGDGGEAAVQQLLAYRSALQRRAEFTKMEIVCVLLSTSTSSSYTDCILTRDYSKFVRNLRRLAIAWKCKKPLQAAATLMMAGAIERNLLSLSGRKIEIAHHLKRFVEQPEYETWE